MSSQTSSLPTPSLTEDEIATYLRAHPEFFETRESLLEQLRLPHHVSGAVSLVERQIRVLRKKNEQLEQKLMTLVKAAQANEQLSSRMHQLALAMISASDLDDVIQISERNLTHAFKADTASVKLLSNDRLEDSSNSVDRDECLGMFKDAFDQNRPVCGTLTSKQQDYLFGDRVEKVGSSVFVPLNHEEPLGYLVLGSHDKNRFHAGMGTLFLGYLGELIAHAISSHQDGPDSAA